MKIHIKVLLRTLLLALTLGTVSCGFKPRGELPLAPPLHNLYLQDQEPYGQLAHILQQYLKDSGVHLAASANTADTVLEVQKEQLGQQLLSVGGTQLTRQYNLSITVSFQVTDKNGKTLVPSQTVSETRTIPISANQTLAGSNEANNLYRQMRLAIGYDIMNILASKNVYTLVNSD